MITLTVERHGVTAVRVRVTARSVQRALELCGGDARAVFPIQPESLFAPEAAAESVESLPAGAAERHTEVAA